MAIDPSDDLDWQELLDQDSDGFYLADAMEGFGSILWGVFAAFIVLMTFALVGMFG